MGNATKCEWTALGFIPQRSSHFLVWLTVKSVQVKNVLRALAQSEGFHIILIFIYWQRQVFNEPVILIVQEIHFLFFILWPKWSINKEISLNSNFNVIIIITISISIIVIIICESA